MRAEAVKKAFDKLPTTNGMKLPPGVNDPNTVMVHEFMVYRAMRSLCNGAVDKLKDKLVETVFDSAPGVGSTAVVYEDSQYIVTCQTKNPRMTLNEAALKSELYKLLPSETVNELFTKCQKQAAPAKEYDVMEKPQ